jgi:pimeloyl-ACP methyl ester carboxylesterase
MALALGGLCSPIEVSQAEAPAPLPLTECRLQSPNVSGSVAARCASLEVLEDRSSPLGKRVRLHVAVIPALRTQAESDALFIISGGPGQAASDFYLAMSHVFARIRRDRDIVIVDQRGTGRSNRLDCPLPNDSDLTEADPSLVQSHTRACLESLPGDPRFYTTSVAVEDLDAARAALQYERINIYGISYGTRVAQQYLRRYPARVRSLVLDGVVPPALALGPHVAVEAQAALDALFNRCSKSAACDEAFPNLRASFASLGAHLKDKPLELTINDPVTAEPLELRFGAAELNGAVRMLTYSDETASTLPLLIHQAQVAQRPEALAAQFEMVKRSMQNQLAYGMHFSVVCTEDAPRWNQERVSEQALRGTYIGADFMKAMRAICEVWPKGTLHEDFSRPLEAATPVLALSGEFDPITPPAYAQRAIEQFTNAKHIVLPGQGHGQLAVGCMPRVVAQFIEGASAEKLNEECLKNISAAPFMISNSGPAP